MAEESYYDAYVRLRSDTDRDEWFVAPELKSRLEADADEQETSVNQVAIAILAARYNVPVEPVRRKSQATANGAILKLQIPLPLKRVIDGIYGSKYQDGIRHALCAHYGLPVPPRRKRTRKRRQAAAA